VVGHYSIYIDCVSGSAAIDNEVVIVEKPLKSNKGQQRVASGTMFLPSSKVQIARINKGPFWDALAVWSLVANAH
jgi:hypothetical protein